nr:hypothetical protein B0A51_00635 [Rachicladosporium sp. CCFEE 5018]
MDMKEARIRTRLKSTARKSLLKQYTLRLSSTSPASSRKKRLTPKRLSMRMKDSDDYLMARAANPRTGLISPSVAGTPQPRTPGSPAEALKISSSCDNSPTLDSQARPALRRANVGRKISAGQRWRADDKGWFNDVMTAAASPRTTDAIAGAADLTHAAPGQSIADRFVVNMPSAREPQPYMYPGRSMKEIEAYEHYRRKTRKVSGEGWDPRRLPGVVIARLNEADGHDVQRSAAVLMAPYASPKTPARRASASRITKPTQLSRAPNAMLMPVSRKPVAGARAQVRERRLSDDSSTSIEDFVGEGITQLSQLPKVRLVPPEFASLPAMHIHPATRHRGHGDTTRKCSLGCDSANPGECSNLSQARNLTQPLFLAADPRAWDLITCIADVYAQLRPYIASSLSLLRRFAPQYQMPRPAMIAVLTAPDASPAQKVAAMRMLFALVGQVMAVLIVVSAIWKLTTALGQIFAAVLWPVVVPLKLVRWVVLGW